MSGPEGLLWGQGDSQVVVVNKTKERVGLALWNEMPERAIIRVVHYGSAAAEAHIYPRSVSWTCFSFEPVPASLSRRL